MSFTKQLYPETITKPGVASDRLMDMENPESEKEGRILTEVLRENRQQALLLSRSEEAARLNAKLLEVEIRDEVQEANLAEEQKRHAELEKEEKRLYEKERKDPNFKELAPHLNIPVDLTKKPIKFSDYPLLNGAYFLLHSFVIPSHKKVRFECKVTGRELDREKFAEANQKKRREKRIAEKRKPIVNQALKELQDLGFGANTALELEAFFNPSVRNAVACWFYKAKIIAIDFHKTINREQFIEVIDSYLDSIGYFERDYLNGVEKKHLGYLFDLYRLMEPSKPDQIGLIHFCHLFLFFNFQDLASLKNEITLAETMDALVSQFPVLKNRLKFLARTRIADEFKKDLKETAFVTLEDGREEIEIYEGRRKRIRYGLCPVLHVRHPFGAILHFPLMYCDPVITQPKRHAGFADLQGNIHLDLSHIDKLVEELRSLETTDPLFSALTEMKLRKLYPHQPIVPKTEPVPENKSEPLKPALTIALSIFSPPSDKAFETGNPHLSLSSESKNGSSPRGFS